MNNSIQQHLSTPRADGRKQSLFKAVCAANRQGHSQEKIMETLGNKSIKIDGLDAKTVADIIADTTSRYASERGAHHGQIQGKIVDSFDEQELVLALTPVPLPAPSGNPVGDLLQFLEALYRPGDTIGFNAWPELNQESQKHYPTTARKYPFEKVIEAIRQKKDVDALMEKNSTGMVLTGRGAFIIVNPLNPFQGAQSDKDVLDYRYTVIESDNMPLELQYAMFRELNLPLAALVHSGGKSLHGIVKIDAERNWKIYKRRVDFLHHVLDTALIRVDGACKNPARWTRLPGYHRKEGQYIDAPQYLVATNIGAPSWDVWEADMLKLVHHYPEPIDIRTLETPPEPLPELIEGILRQRGKMLVSGPSKSGKSMLLLQLANALATGNTWLGFQCAKSIVVYLNLEISGASCVVRACASAQALGLNMAQHNGLYIINYDQSSPTIESMIKNVSEQAIKLKANVVIVDPVYNLFGDETNAGEVKKLTRALAAIGGQAGVAVIFCHHFNKGTSSTTQANHIDRVAGSAVFGRFPDTIMTFTPGRDDCGMAHLTLREFADPEPFQIRFNYPLFSRVEDGLAGAGNPPPAGTGLKGRKPKITDQQFRDYLDKNPGATPQSIATAFGISQSGAYDRLAKLKKANITPLTNPAIENQDSPIIIANPVESIMPVEAAIAPLPDQHEQNEPSSSCGSPDDQGDDDTAKGDDTDSITEEELECRRERLKEAHAQMPAFETEEERQKREMEILDAFV